MQRMNSCIPGITALLCLAGCAETTYLSEVSQAAAEQQAVTLCQLQSTAPKAHLKSILMLKIAAKMDPTLAETQVAKETLRISKLLNCLQNPSHRSKDRESTKTKTN